ncbi:MAG: AI-2E family transporter [Coprobacillus sp.]
MKKFISKEELKTMKPWLILAVFSISFYLIASHLLAVKDFVIFIINLLQPLIIAIAFAYILNIPMMFIERNIKKISRKGGFIYKSSRGISVALTIILTLVAVLLIGSILLPKILESLAQLLSNMGILLKNIATNIDEVLIFFNIDYQLKDMAQVNNIINMPWQDIFKNVINVLASSANGILSNAMSFTTVFFKWFMAFMFSLYMLNGKETLLRQLRKVCIVFFKQTRATQLFDYGKHANIIFKSFITGQLTEACIIATIYYIGMIIFGFPYPELIAMIIAVFSLVPVFGPICAMMIGIFLVMSSDFIMAIWFLVFFQVLSQIEDNLIYPRVVGKSVGLPGLWVMLSIFILGDLFGLVGMLVAVPVTAFAYTLFSRWIHKSLKDDCIQIDDDGYVIEKQDN